MPSIRAIYTQPWHFKLVNVEDTLSFLGPDERAWMFSQMIAVTILHKTEIAAIIGIYPLWKGVAEALFVPGPAFLKCKKSVIVYTRQWVNSVMGIYSLHRLQATVNVEKASHSRFIEFLGFKKEGTLNNYMPNGGTMHMYARIE